MALLPLVGIAAAWAVTNAFNSGSWGAALLAAAMVWFSAVLTNVPTLANDVLRKRGMSPVSAIVLAIPLSAFFPLAASFTHPFYGLMLVVAMSLTVWLVRT